MRRIGAQLMAIGIAAAMLCVAGAHCAAAQATKSLTMGSVYLPAHAAAQAARQFADKLAEASDGKLTVAHHHSGVLGTEREVAQQIQAGTVDLGPLGAAQLAGLVPELAVFQLPYIFRDYEHAFQVLDGDGTVAGYYEGVLDRKGMKLVGVIVSGYRALYGHAPVNELADLKGRKVRVQEDRILVSTFRSLGMIAVPIAFQEVASALQNKAIDYTEGPITTFHQNRLDEVVKHVADLRHSHQAAALVMSKASWAKLDAAERRAVGEAWAQARAFNRKFVREEDLAMQDQVRAKGVVITKPDTAPFRAAIAGVYEEFYATAAGKDARKIVEFILAVK